jgi:hypothetical protein
MALEAQGFWVERERPHGTVLGLAGGTGGFSGRGNPPSMPRATADLLAASGEARPNGYTGLWKGAPYYKGAKVTMFHKAFAPAKKEAAE